jgi:hypothetical protein
MTTGKFSSVRASGVDSLTSLEKAATFQPLSKNDTGYLRRIVFAFYFKTPSRTAQVARNFRPVQPVATVEVYGARPCKLSTKIRSARSDRLSDVKDT